VAERSKLITGEKIKPGDALIGLPSSGLHSNGYSLVRKICFDLKQFSINQDIPELGKTLGEELLIPTKLYPKACLPLIEKFDIRGMVHITGGGFYENIPRVLPEGCGVEVNTEAWSKPQIFELVQQWGNVAWPEMYRTFNMGIGMILVVPQSEVTAVQEDLTARGETSYVIGHVTAGPREAVLKGGIFGE